MARYGSDGYYGGWAPYISVAERRKKAAEKVKNLKAKGKVISPVHVQGRAIAQTFWGKAWCDHLESYSDYSNRLPRGRTYVRNGSVIDLQIETGAVIALVSGSSIYTVKIEIKKLPTPQWKTVIQECSGQIGSLVELLQGRFSKGVMEVITHPERGLFPSPKQIGMDCSCPDSAVMCKHVAAVLYGVGTRLDHEPELFFKLRNVDHSELLAASTANATLTRGAKGGKTLKSTDLSALFGIELEGDGIPKQPADHPAMPAPVRHTKRSAAPAKAKTKKTLSARAGARKVKFKGARN